MPFWLLILFLFIIILVKNPFPPQSVNTRSKTWATFLACLQLRPSGAWCPRLEFRFTFGHRDINGENIARFSRERKRVEWWKTKKQRKKVNEIKCFFFIYCYFDCGWWTTAFLLFILQTLTLMCWFVYVFHSQLTKGEDWFVWVRG